MALEASTFRRVQAGHGVIDTACTKLLLGSDTLAGFSDRMSSFGLRIIRAKDLSQSSVLEMVRLSTLISLHIFLFVLGTTRGSVGLHHTGLYASSLVAFCLAGSRSGFRLEQDDHELC